MNTPIIMYISSVSQALPIVAAFAVWGRHQPAPYPRLILWCLLMLGADVLDLAVRSLGPNAFTSYIMLPLEVGATLWVLAAWQPTAFLRLVYMMAIAVAGTIVAILLILVDPVKNFDLWIGPSLALLALVGVLHTLVHRALISGGLLTEQGWFWVCLGIGLFWLCFISVPPFYAAYIHTDMRMIVRVLIVRAWVVMACFLFITWGIVCQKRQAR